MTNFRFEGVKRSVLNEAMTFCRIFYQMNRFLRNRATLKITLLQRYEVLWIHNIDAICTWVDCLLKFLHRIISSVVDSRRNPLAIRISSVVDWRRIWWAAIHYIIVNMNFNLNLDWEALKKKVKYTNQNINGLEHFITDNWLGANNCQTSSKIQNSTFWWKC